MKKVFLMLVLGAFITSCGPSVCDCINTSKKEKKEQDNKKQATQNKHQLNNVQNQLEYQQIKNGNASKWKKVV